MTDTLFPQKEIPMTPQSRITIALLRLVAHDAGTLAEVLSSHEPTTPDDHAQFASIHAELVASLALAGEQFKPKVKDKPTP